MNAPGPARRLGRTLAVLLGALALLGIPAGAAQAHPVGDFSVNVYDGLTVGRKVLRVDHVEDLAEIPATRALAAMDRSGDGRTSAAERARWARQVCARVADGVRVSVAGRARPAASDARAARARSLPGRAGLRTVRLECALTARVAVRDATALRFAAATGAAGEAPGWREITARGDRVRLPRSDVPARSVTARLTRYPKDLLATPPRRHRAELRAVPGGPPAERAARPAPDGGAVALPGGDALTERFTGLIGGRRLTPVTGVVAVALALVLGAGHALAPGHGKTVMAAYAAAKRRASLPDVLRTGAAVTVTHTTGVLLLGLLVTAGSLGAQAVPAALPWLTAASGLLVAVAGTTLLRTALRHRAAHDHGTHHHPHTHAVLGDGTHTHGPPTGTGGGHPHGSHGSPADPGGSHPHGEHAPAENTRTPAQLALAESTHTHARHAHPHDTRLTAPHPYAEHTPPNGTHPHAEHAPAKGAHSHAKHPHQPAERQLPPPAPRRIRDTLLLGFAGGLVPSPSAVLVLVGSSALGQLWFGVLLVTAYGAGLALTLVAVGLLLVRAGARLSRWTSGAHPRHARLLDALHRTAPTGTAALVVLLGTLLAVRGLVAV